MSLSNPSTHINQASELCSSPPLAMVFTPKLGLRQGCVGSDIFMDDYR
jgi:hypothetical protein